MAACFGLVTKTNSPQEAQDALGGTQALADEVKRFSTVAASAVPFAGSVVGWALGEALQHLVLYLGDVQQYPAHCRELIELLGNPRSRVHVMLAALDEYTDRHDPEAAAARGEHNEMCALLQRAQLLLADAHAYVRDADLKPDAQQPSSPERTSFLTACIGMRGRRVSQAPRWRDAPAVQAVYSELAARCSPDQCRAVTDALRLLRIELPRRQPEVLQRHAQQPATQLEPVRGEHAVLAATVPRHALVQIYESAVLRVEELLTTNATVAIVGGGGTGKTTLAEAVYDGIKARFDACHFMRVGRDANFHHLLEAAWKDVFGDACESRDAVSLWGQLSGALGTKKVLVVLDDLWLHDSTGRQVNMLDALNFATPPDVQHAAGSRLLVTARDSRTLSYQPHVCNPVRIGVQYAMPLLEDVNATALFLSHAVAEAERAAMSTEQHKLVQQFVAKGAGNPKALQLLGGRVRSCGNDVREWRNMLSSYQSGGADVVNSICRTSYDALRPSLQMCVRELSFFPEDARLEEAELVHLFATHAPVGGSKATAAARSKLRELVQCSLVDMKETQELERPIVEYGVHDIVHDLSKAIAAQSVVGRHACGQLVQHGGGLIDVLLSPSKLAMRAQVKSGTQDDTSGHASWVQQADIQAVRYVSLHRTGCPDMSRLRLLQFLQLSRCDVGSLPDSIGECGQLAHLRCSYCSALATLPRSIGSCGQLTNLELKWCHALTTLPDSLGSCSQLTRLDLSCCHALIALPKGISGCSRLVHLDLSYCKALAALPEGIGGCSQLVRLDLRWCVALMALPQGIGGCKQLAHLELSGCKSLAALPKGIGGCVQLTHLDMHSCPSLVTVPQGIDGCSRLAHLDLSDCSTLTALPQGLAGCSQLAYLDLSGCWLLAGLPEGIGGCGRLAYLYLRRCKVLRALPEAIGGCSQLQNLRLHGCVRLVKLPEGIGSCGQLRILDLDGCSALAALPKGIAGCSRLERISMRGCEVLQGLPQSIGSCKLLSSLDLSGCKALTALPSSLPACELLASGFFSLQGCTALLALSLPESIVRLRPQL